jgi:hypothetical protein
MFAGFTQRLNFGMGGGGTISVTSAFPTRPIGQLGNFNTYAVNFIAATNITDPTQQSAINQLSYELVNSGLMDKMVAVYPFVGGTASTHQYNLKDPRDDDSAYRLSFVGGFTHSSSGIQGNGTNAYANTYLNAANRFAGGAALHVSLYSTTTVVPAGTLVDFGHTLGSNIIQMRINSQNILGSTTPVLTFTTTTNSGGFWVIQRRSNTDREIYRNGITEASSAVSNTSAYPSGNLYIFARNTATGTPDFYSPRNFAFCSIGTALSDEEALVFYNIVQNFQTTLGRNV